MQMLVLDGQQDQLLQSNLQIKLEDKINFAVT